MFDVGSGCVFKSQNGEKWKTEKCAIHDVGRHVLSLWIIPKKKCASNPKIFGAHDCP